MIDTRDLIDRLADDALPVRRLRPPAIRAAAYIALALAVFAGLVAWQGLRADLAQRLAATLFCLCLGGALLTGALAAISAAVLAVPGRSRRWLLLPLPALAIWLASVGQSCLTGWIGLTANAVHADEVRDCALSLLAAALPLTLAMLVMLRRAAPIRLWPATLAGGLAASGLTSAAMTLLHPHDASVMVLIWNVGVLAVVMALQVGASRWPTETESGNHAP